MKKTFTKIGLVLGLMVPFGTFAQTFFSENFNGANLTSNNAWIEKDATGTLDWGLGDFGGLSYAVISGFVGSPGANVDAETWLITPAIDLNGKVNPMLSFTNAYSNHTGPNAGLKISTNYDGTSAPSSATWTDLSYTAATGSFQWTESGDIDLTSFNTSTVHIAFQYLSTTAGSKKLEIDNFILFDGQPTPPPTLSIAQVQATTSGDLSDMVGDAVTVGGIVSAVVPTKGFYIQDAISQFSGIYIYDLGANQVEIGDSVLLSGTVEEFAFGGSIGAATQITTLSSFDNRGAYTAFAPIDLSTAAVNDEAYEGMLVKVSEVTNVKLAGGNFEVIDGSADSVLIDKFIYTFPFPVLNTLYSSITGVVGHGYEEYKIYPRMASDMVISPFNAIDENENTSISVYPNTVISVLTIKNAVNSVAKIVSADGKEMNELKVNSNNFDVNVEQYPAGLYFLQINGNSVKFIKK